MLFLWPLFGAVTTGTLQVQKHFAVRPLRDYSGGPLAPPWLVPGDCLYIPEVSSLTEIPSWIRFFNTFSSQPYMSNIPLYLCMRQILNSAPAALILLMHQYIAYKDVLAVRCCESPCGPVELG
jgi:hypothetical protein